MLWCECALLIAVSILSRCATRNSERLMLRTTVSIVLSDFFSELMTYINKVCVLLLQKKVFINCNSTQPDT